MTTRKNLITGGLILLGVGILSLIIVSCNNKDGKVESGDNKADSNEVKPLNLSVFIDLSDRIEKESDSMLQSEKDQAIIKALAEQFYKKQEREVFSNSTDAFQIVFYPSPPGGDSLSANLSLDLGNLKKPNEKSKALLDFKEKHAGDIKSLYSKALKTKEYFGSDIWGFFSKDKVSDYLKEGYRNVLIILSDGYVFDVHDKLKEGKNYSYILPQTLNVGGGLIPCKISNPDMEVYFLECNANPQTDFPKMKNVLEQWFQDMGVTVIDVQDTDIPTNTIRHLNNRVFNK